MNKELLGFFAFFIALFVGALYFSDTVQSPFISALNSIKSSYRDTVTTIDDTIDKHFFQASEIQRLKEKLLIYEKGHVLMVQLSKEANDLFAENNSSLKINPNVELVRVLSYEKFGDFNRLWLDLEDFNTSKIYGLTHQDTVAGIAVEYKGRALALLNKDPKSSYAVYVGGEFAPGVAHGNNSQNLIVKFIPTWIKIHPGDEVITSGLDAIFFKGLKVGKVLSVSSLGGFQSALVEPYYKENDPNYFHMIRSIR
ncbi:MAG: rod shape-determining protein MreC [Sulfurimonas sp.]|jgi:rod shape-determining protein MreC|nr:rod shape-determining protein MreC [Sulfurimonas sp.]MBU1216924.1 rod shape-determining protein MreC [bacterium]MBU1435051.1 rod shape-determining protein MreC [bacterium]MBU1504156.1 rod shape-determining protein MreC [bacterium]MBU3939975.1 rod shape-determining protein MreC [bacterium]